MIVTMCVKQYCTHYMGKLSLKLGFMNKIFGLYFLFYNSGHYCFCFILLCNVSLVLMFSILDSFRFYLPPLSS